MIDFLLRERERAEAGLSDLGPEDIDLRPFDIQESDIHKLAPTLERLVGDLIEDVRMYGVTIRLAIKRESFFGVFLFVRHRCGSRIYELLGCIEYRDKEHGFLGKTFVLETEEDWQAFRRAWEWARC